MSFLIGRSRYHILIFLLISLTLLNFSLNALPAAIKSGYISSIISILILAYCFGKGYKVKLSGSLIVTTVFPLALSCIAILSAIIHNTFEYNLISLPLRVVSYTSISLAICYIARVKLRLEHHESIAYVLKIVCLVFAFHSVVIISQYSSFEAREFFYSIFNVGKAERYVVSGARLSGIMESMPIISFTHGIVATISFYLYVTGEGKKYLFLYFLIFVPMLFVARTGLFLAAFVPIVFLAFDWKINFKRYLFFFTVFSVFALALLFFALHTDSMYLKRSFEMFYGFFSTGSFATSSTNDLISNHWAVVPDSAGVLLFGAGTADTAILGLSNTDVGFLRMVFFSGLIGLLITFFCYIFIHVSLYSIAVNKKAFKALVFIFFFSWIMLNMKDYVIFGGGHYFIIVVLSYLAYSPFGFLEKSNLSQSKMVARC